MWGGRDVGRDTRLEKRSKTAEKDTAHRERGTRERGRGENGLFWWFYVILCVIARKVLWGGDGFCYSRTWMWGGTQRFSLISVRVALCDSEDSDSLEAVFSWTRCDEALEGGTGPWAVLDHYSALSLVFLPLQRCSSKVWEEKGKCLKASAPFCSLSLHQRGGAGKERKKRKICKFCLCLGDSNSVPHSAGAS